MIFSKKKIIISGPAPPLFDYGGPIRSLSSFYKEFSKHFFIVWISINKFHDGQNLVTDKLDEIIYTKNEFLKIIVKSKKEDTIWLNSFFELKTLLLPFLLINNKIIISPRGQLADKAISTSNYFMKYIFIKIFRIIQNRVVFHSTSTDESLNIKNIFNSKVFEIPNLFKLEYDFNSCLDKKIVFFSRISKKKGLLDFLEIYSKIKINITLDIYGYIEDETYWHQCKSFINNDQRISYKGALLNGNFKKLKDKYSFFLLPTYNENFGHSIIEALSLGLIPLVTKDTTPFEKHMKYYFNLGYELNYISIKKVINEINEMNNSKLLSLKKETSIMFSKIAKQNDENIIKYKNIFK